MVSISGDGGTAQPLTEQRWKSQLWAFLHLCFPWRFCWGMKWDPACEDSQACQLFIVLRGHSETPVIRMLLPLGYHQHQRGSSRTLPGLSRGRYMHPKSVSRVPQSHHTSVSGQQGVDYHSLNSILFMCLLELSLEALTSEFNTLPDTQLFSSGAIQDMEFPCN